MCRAQSSQSCDGRDYTFFVQHYEAVSRRSAQAPANLVVGSRMSQPIRGSTLVTCTYVSRGFRRDTGEKSYVLCPLCPPNQKSRMQLTCLVSWGFHPRYLYVSMVGSQAIGWISISVWGKCCLNICALNYFVSLPHLFSAVEIDRQRFPQAIMAIILPDTTRVVTRLKHLLAG